MQWRHPFEEQLARCWPPGRWRDATVLVAVSGGPDSVALLCGLAAVREPGRGLLVAGHFNHALRGAESDADEAFVRDLCGQLGLPCEVGHPRSCSASGTYPASETCSGAGGCSEARAREQRYRFFREAAGRIGARYVATAHTADDQAETILHRILRGTGIAGLGGIRRARPLDPGVSLIRPLLAIPRVLLQDYLAALQQPCRQDSTNTQLRFTRNRLRHELLPHLAAHYNPRVVAALTRLGSQAAEVQALLERAVEELRGRAVVDARDAAVTIDCAALAGSPPWLVRELFVGIWRRQHWPLRSMSHARWEQLAELASAPSAGAAAEGPARKHVLPGNIRAERTGPLLALRAPMPLRPE